MRKIRYMLLLAAICTTICLTAQPPAGRHWAKTGDAYYESNDNGITLIQLPALDKKVVVDKSALTPKDSTHPLQVRNFFFSQDGSKVLIYTNTKRVWRYDTRGDYWLLDIGAKSLRQIGKGLPESSLMFAKGN